VTVTPDVALRRDGIWLAGRRMSALLLYGALPALLLAYMLGRSVHDHFAFDFHQFWQGGHDVVHGHSPYPAAGSVPDGGDPSLDPEAIQAVFRFPYPAPAAFLMVPFGAMPFWLAAGLFVIASGAAIVVALRLLGLEDWRCYGIVFASMPALGALRLGTLTPLLLLGLALAWRFRDRLVVCAAIVGSLIAVKLFLWPIAVWLLVSRRFATAALTAAIAAGATIVSWAVLGFAGMADYPAQLSSLTASVQAKGWSVVSLAVAVGAPATAGKVAAALVAAALFCWALVVRRDAWTFTVAVVVALLLSPIVWLHYFLLLAAPLAIRFPALAPPWALLLLFWISPFQETDGDVWRIGVGLVVLACACIVTPAGPPKVRPA
jgi:Glycosyltransferase family 87